MLAADQIKFDKLQILGAGEFGHINGSLLEHLRATSELLLSWGASDILVQAGLFHAAYGTDGFEDSLVSSARRSEIAAIIGGAAEEVVYTYCACDRDYFWPQFGGKVVPEHKDRFTGELRVLTENELQSFCELTAANEIEIAIKNQEFKISNPSYFSLLFENMKTYLSEMAIRSAIEVFGESDKQQ